jgi:hypothetical protein
MKNLALIATAVLALAGCAQTSYQVYEGRSAQIIEGQGGTKQIIDGYEIWDNGNPPRRYQVLGVATVEHFDTPPGNAQIRSAIAAQIKEAGGSAAIVMDTHSQGGSSGTSVAFIGGKPVYGFGSSNGRKKIRVQVIKYLD